MSSSASSTCEENDSVESEKIPPIKLNPFLIPHVRDFTNIFSPLTTNLLHLHNSVLSLFCPGYPTNLILLSICRSQIHASRLKAVGRMWKNIFPPQENFTLPEFPAYQYLPKSGTGWISHQHTTRYKCLP